MMQAHLTTKNVLCTHQFTEDDDTNRIFVLSVRSNGILCPGMWISEQKLFGLTIPVLSIDSAGGAEAV